jgi:hypothetical protein
MWRTSRLALFTRLAACAVMALGVATPAAAQFGGLKKKLKAAAGSKSTSQGEKAAGSGATPATPAAQAPSGGAGGGSVVLTAEVVDHLVAGLKAAKATRLAAQKEDTPYGRFQQAVTAYDTAKVKCQEAQRAFPNRMAANQKLSDRYSALVDKMVNAQGKGDAKLTQVYSDSAMAMQDPSCVVKQPTQPNDYYDAQRAIDSRAEQDAVSASGLSAAEYSMALERAEGILRGGPPADVSASETSAVNARGADLKPLLGIQNAPATRARKSEPAATPDPAPGAATPAPPGSAGNDAMGTCMSQNAQKHQKEIEALGQRAQAAQQAGNTAAMMAIADTLQQIQMAGCMGAK